MENAPYIRPATPQALLHRAPDKPADTHITKPNKYIILLLAPTFVAGKVQIATLVSKALSCPLYQGDSLHESSAKAASVGADRSDDGGKGRYQRMWLSKMTRTGLLFPEESRPANEGPSSTSTSRRGSGSSISSTVSLSSAPGSTIGFAMDAGSQFMNSGGVRGNQYINQPVFSISEEERLRKLNPALMVLTHPEMEAWHKDAIRGATGEYGIGIIFVPLFKSDVENDDVEEEELPVLKPLDPSMIRGFTSFDAIRAAAGSAKKEEKYGQGKGGNLKEEMVLDVGVEGNVDEIAEEVVRGVRNVMFAGN